MKKEQQQTDETKQKLN